MLTQLEFWKGVLPPEGPYCVLGIVGVKQIHSQTFHTSLDEVKARVDHLDQKKINSFVALAQFKDDSNRTGANTICLKSLFLDLDCDPNDPKKYPDQVAAIQDLKRFVKEAKFPRPITINSGYGVHAYWPLTETVPTRAWKRLADKLKSTCFMAGMKIDPAVSADSARVLRAVGTSNWKDRSNPLPVEVLNSAAPVDVSVFRALLNVSESPIDDAPTSRPLDDITKSLLANRPASFRLIIKKTIEGKGCQQLADAMMDQENTSEPIWRAALSIAQFCKDRDKAIHAISSKHPEYSATDTEAKAARIQGPYRCDTFGADNPKGCEGCIHKGKIASPIVLGRGEVEVATVEDNIVKSAVEPDKVYVIPEYPFPFVRGKTGGIYVKAEDADGNPADKPVYENDFYLMHTVDDPIEGMSGLFRLHLPHDGVREFLIPLREMIAKDVFGKRVSMQGISTVGKQMEQLMGYSNMAVKAYLKLQRAAKSRLQFGWADNFTAFIVGDRQITAKEVKYSPPSSQTLGLVKAFRKEGTLEGWKKIASFYNQPGMELHMFTLFTGFGSPLVPFVNKRKGAVISLYSPGAGTGKTTTLHMINSIFGHPEELMMIKADTMNARVHRLGIMNNITPTIDEITNEKADETSEFLYHYLHARGKNRLINQVNGERVNTTTWGAHCVVTANEAIEDKLFAKKRNPDGEMARFLEFEYTPGNNLNKEDSDLIFKQIHTHFGVAGEPYIQHVLREMGGVQDALDKMQLAVDRGAGLTQRERYWSSAATTILVGGLMARQAGVLDFTDEDFARVFKWCVANLKNKRGHATKVAHDPSTMLGSFLSEHINDTLVISGVTTRKTGDIPPVPKREPRGKLYVRYEFDTQTLYVNKPKFRQYCGDGHVSFNSVLERLTKDGKYLGDKKMRMGKGLHISEPENVLVFRFVDEEKVLDPDTRDTGTD